METDYIDAAITGWIAAKGDLSGSAETRKRYTRIITQFRAWLRAKGRDLDLATWADVANAKAWRRAGATFVSEVQQFAGHPLRGKSLSPAARKQKITVLRSFYTYAIDKGYFDDYANPVAKVEQPRVPVYGNVHPLNPEKVAAKMRSIDRTKKAGIRNFAILAMYLETGRRRNEILSTLWGDVEMIGDLSQIASPESIRLKIHFRCKGGKTEWNLLSAACSSAVLQCVAVCHGMNPIYLDAARPLWISLSTANYGKPLGRGGIAQICKTCLDTTRLHQLRHTFAQVCYEAGLQVPDVQVLLGHTHMATTAVYLEALTKQQGENRVMETLDRVLGIV